MSSSQPSWRTSLGRFFISLRVRVFLYCSAINASSSSLKEMRMGSFFGSFASPGFLNPYILAYAGISERSIS